MKFSPTEKKALIHTAINILKSQKEIERIIVFGSFVDSDNPKDMDLAIFQNSNDNYMTLAMKYRKLVRDISKKIPVDILPLRSNKSNIFISDQINSGEVVYERR